ncbi:uncharacterized protein QYS62_005364 [Fusarium acuminatum]|uniref:Uncharacterized protein n=1 Tax=Fusarium acuminatum TaxID=5515 RepID=A0ABZ2WWM4_9HYPO
MSNQQVTLDAFKVNPLNIDQRRAFISAYAQQFGHECTAKLALEQREGIIVICEALSKYKVTQIGTGYFEYAVDHTAWYHTFEHLGEDAPAWPWKERPHRDDISTGISPVYKKWRLEHGLPIGPPQHEATQRNAPKPEQDINEAVSSIVPVLSALDRMKNPVVLEKGPRETIWNAMYGDGPHVGAICGPFEIILPSWVDFEGLVCGKDGGLIDQIHDGIIQPYQRVSWYNTGGRPFALVVGVSADVKPTSLSVQYSMRDLWSGVLQWAIEAYNGGTVSLATFLRVRQVAYHGGESTNFNQDARVAFQNSESNIPLAKREALLKRQYMAACSPVVNAIIQKPWKTPTKSSLLGCCAQRPTSVTSAFLLLGRSGGRAA